MFPKETYFNFWLVFLNRVFHQTPLNMFHFNFQGGDAFYSFIYGDLDYQLNFRKFAQQGSQYYNQEVYYF